MGWDLAHGLSALFYPFAFFSVPWTIGFTDFRAVSGIPVAKWHRTMISTTVAPYA
ncbi:hypothetical protein EV363DRAFT_1181625 [Boletus edulis]|uniref:Uncharacterized protein n=1 Tax=Boletus edulis BED1 TaxID=1328754 RepID=A0AAD4BHC2_BOLED|nr:hypothetical protein EV363DRAFT_1181625 [Boletus edulis]KAF8430527.1 hypothetical protein L210DRAFT_942102 [Boletus edulis BED1]